MALRLNNELFGACLLAVAAVGLAWVAPSSIAQLVVGLPLVLFLPGYALLAALFPRRSDLKAMEWLTLSFALSLAITPLVVVTHNVLLSTIRPGPLAMSLAGIVMACSIVAEIGRRRVPPEEREGAGITSTLRQVRIDGKRRIPAVAIVLVCAVLVGARLVFSAPGTSEAFTEFYLLGPSSRLQDYPRQISVGDPVRVVVGITNHEFRPVEYQVVAQADGRPLARLGPIRLRDGQRWTREVQFTPPGPAPREEITILLLRDGVVAPYRNLHLWLRVLPR